MFTQPVPMDKVELSTVEAVSIGVAEVGLSLINTKPLWANTLFGITS